MKSRALPSPAVGSFAEIASRTTAVLTDEVPRVTVPRTAATPVSVTTSVSPTLGALAGATAKEAVPVWFGAVMVAVPVPDWAPTR